MEDAFSQWVERSEPQRAVTRPQHEHRRRPRTAADLGQARARATGRAFALGDKARRVRALVVKETRQVMA